uniref:Uncharacterized protein n=1 Tax=Arundo donax TaxID=35708 RepID=A0A0A9FXE8_ARUDO
MIPGYTTFINQSWWQLTKKKSEIDKTQLIGRYVKMEVIGASYSHN